jgi:hypothetical protein
MAKTFYFDSLLGHSSHAGTGPFDALRDANDFNTLVLEPGDRVLFHAGQAFDGNFVLSRSGAEGREIVIDTYTLGGETTRWATFTGDPTATRPIAWDVNASYVKLTHVQASGARYAGFLFREKQAHIEGSNLRMRNCGIGARLRGSQITLTHPDVQGATMSRFQHRVTDEGGVAFSVEADGWLNEGNTIAQAFVYGAIAPADDKFDGGDVEIFGDVVGLTVENSVFLFSKGGVEIGGPSRQSGQVPSTTRDVTFRKNLFIHTGVLALFNDPGQTFPIRVQNMRFLNNTIYDRTRNLSAVYFNGAWGDVSRVVRFEGNIYDGLGSWVGGKGTLLDTIPHTGNLYQRLGSTSLGYTLSPDEWQGDPGFVNPAGLDFRLKSTPNAGLMRVIPGALGPAQTYDSLVDLKWLLKQTRTPLDANNFIGGLHSYPSHSQMWAIPQPLRRAGMECSVSAYDQRWRLAEDLTTWLQN